MLHHPYQHSFISFRTGVGIRDGFVQRYIIDDFTLQKLTVKRRQIPIWWILIQTIFIIHLAHLRPPTTGAYAESK